MVEFTEKIISLVVEGVGRYYAIDYDRIDFHGDEYVFYKDGKVVRRVNSQYVVEVEVEELQ